MKKTTSDYKNKLIFLNRKTQFKPLEKGNIFEILMKQEKYWRSKFRVFDTDNTAVKYICMYTV